MSRHDASSTARLLELCAGYLGSYVLTGVLVKYFTVVRDPAMPEMAFLFNNTLGGSLFALGLVLLLRWPGRLQSTRSLRVGPLTFPREVAYIVPSGICTAIVIPTTTLMYTLPISVMVAMVIMRGSVIVISRAVDALQIRQGILKKRVYHEENLAVVFAILAVGTNVLLIPLVEWLERSGVHVAGALGVKVGAGRGSFDFLGSVPAMTILGLYIGAYSLRIYIMNYYKNTRGAGVRLDNRGFFAVEQIAAAVAMVTIGALCFVAPAWWGATDVRLVDFRAAVQAPDAAAILSGLPYGVVAFFSVFIFMFEGRTATFAGLVNRLTSLVAGTIATLIAFFAFGLKFPSLQDWVSVAFILIAVYFLSIAERKRAAELALAAGSKA